MSTLSISFDGHTQNAFFAHATIKVFDENLQRIADETTLVTSILNVEVPRNGLYLVHAELPSGEQLTSNVVVESAEMIVFVQLMSKDRSPRESLAWAYAIQSVTRSSRRETAGPPDVTPGPLFFPPTIDVIDAYRVQVKPGVGAPQLVRAPVSIVRDPEVRAADPRLLHAFALNLDPGAYNATIPNEFSPFPALIHLRVLTETSIIRNYFVMGPVDPYVTSMAYGRPDSGVLVVRAAMTGTGETNIRVLVNFGSSAVSLLGYLTAGSYAAARRVGEDIVDTAVQMLREKRLDPFGACIAGYFLLLSGLYHRRDWMRNLANWFPAIPDGAIIYGVCLLEDPDSNSDDQLEGRRFLIEASRRGVPIFTIGVRLLFDHLRASVGRQQELQEDSLFQDALARIRYIAASTDWNAATTTFNIPTETDELPSAVRYLQLST